MSNLFNNVLEYHCYTIYVLVFTTIMLSASKCLADFISKKLADLCTHALFTSVP